MVMHDVMRATMAWVRPIWATGTTVSVATTVFVVTTVATAIDGVGNAPIGHPYRTHTSIAMPPATSPATTGLESFAAAACAGRCGTIVTIGLFLLAGSGCLVGPDYCRPAAPVSPTWQHGGNGHYLADGSDVHAWWLDFNDPVLEGLVFTALDQNLGLREAYFRILQARYRSGVVRGDLFPSADAKADYSYRKLSRNGNTFGSSPNAFEPFSLYSSGFDVNWETDLFGRYRRILESAHAEIGVAVEDRHAVLVTLLADIATSYTETRMLEEQIGVAQRNLELQQRTHELTFSRARSGLVDEFDVKRAESNMYATAAAVPRLEAARQNALNRLCVLSGQPPRDMSQWLEPTATIPVASSDIDVGLPAHLLRRRPDVRKAEREIHAHCARVGAATAELYPELNILGTLNVDSRDFATMFASNSIAHSVGPSLKWDILNFGRVRNKVRVSEARWGEAVAAYRNTVLEAAEEVEDAMIDHLREQERTTLLTKAVAAARTAAHLAQSRYGKGLVEFTGLVDAQRSQLLLEEQLVLSRASITLDRIRLYRARGAAGRFRPRR